MMTITIDPKDRQNLEPQLLAALFQDYPNTSVFEKDTEYFITTAEQETARIKLLASIIKRESKQSTPRFEPMGDVLGQGSFGQVAVSTGALKQDHKTIAIANPDKQRVIKHLRKLSHETAENFKERINKEYELSLLTEVLHPKKPVFSANGHDAYIVMRKVGQYSLFEWLCSFQKDASLEDLKGLSIAILEAVIQLHKKGIVHRDLKPENIQISYENGKFTATIIDLGLAELATHLKNVKGQFIGSHFYFSPEVLQKQQYSFASDAFATGMILWEIWGGKNESLKEKIAENFKNKSQLDKALLKDLTAHNKLLSFGLKNIFKEIEGLTDSKKKGIKTLIETLLNHENLEARNLQAVQSSFEKIKLPAPFFHTKTSTDLINALKKADRHQVKKLLTPAFLASLNDEHADTKKIAATLVYLKEGLKHSSIRGFFPGQTISDNRLKTAHEILSALKAGQYLTVKDTIEKLPVKSRLKGALAEHASEQPTSVVRSAKNLIGGF